MTFLEIERERSRRQKHQYPQNAPLLNNSTVSKDLCCMAGLPMALKDLSNP